MKIEQTHIDQIRSAFDKMQSREDFLHVLNEAKPLVYGDKAVPFELKQLTWYANPKLGSKRYAEFKIKKKSGAERCIHAPVKGLKSLQKTLSFVLQCVFEPHIAAMGFVRDRSIVDNAKLHVGSKYVYNIDLKDFFPSVDQARVWKCMQLKPFKLAGNDLITSESILNNDQYLIPVQPGSKKRAQKVLMYVSNKKLQIPKRIHSLTLENGNKLNYSIESLNRLVVFKDTSDIEFLFKKAEKLKIEKGLENELEFIVAALILKLIKEEGKNFKMSSKADIANIIASLCCTEMEVERKNEAGEWEKVKRNVLPQGAPTSPVITNIVCQRLDYLLSAVAKRFGLKYSRYADDITFSSMYNVYQPESDFLKEIHRIVTDQNFHIKESKTRLQKDGYRKEVTGLLVNDKVNVQQRYIKQLRMWLYYWEKYGYERASGFFLQQYIADKGHLKKGKPNMTNVIAGKLDFLKMVKGVDNELYLKLNGRFDALSGTINPLEELLNIWENKGIDVAMNHYYKVNTK